MNIPGQIEFMSQTWLCRAAEPRELDNCLGQCDPTTNTIIIDPTLPPSVMLQTLTHEYLHLIEMTLNLQFTEQQIDAMASGIVHLFKANPGITELYLSREANNVAEMDNE